MEAETKILGICVYCRKPIYEGKKFEMIIYDVPSPWNKEYPKGPVHMRCRLPLMRRLNSDLMRDISTLTWFIEDVMRKDSPIIPTTIKSGKRT